jgi:hypothetical protein
LLGLQIQFELHKRTSLHIAVVYIWCGHIVQSSLQLVVGTTRSHDHISSPPGLFSSQERDIMLKKATVHPFRLNIAIYLFNETLNGHAFLYYSACTSRSYRVSSYMHREVYGLISLEAIAHSH